MYREGEEYNWFKRDPQEVEYIDDRGEEEEYTS